MGNEDKGPEIPRYSPNKFVSRIDEITWVQSQVQKLLDGQEPEARALEFWGPRGSGKSWLLQHLATERYQPPDEPPGEGETGRELEFDGRVHSLYLDLNHFCRPGLAPDEGVLELIDAIDLHLGQWLGQPSAVDLENASLAQRSDRLAGGIEELARSRVLVLLLDHVSEQPAAFLEPLESRVLAPLARVRGVLLVMSKRGKGYPWRAGVIRWSLRDRNLDFFDVDATRQQLERWGLDGDRAPDVWRQSGGCPLTNYFLPQSDGVHRAAEALLDGVLAPDRDRVEALCILRFVREEHLPRMLAACKADSSLCEQEEEQTKIELQRLVDLGFLRWDRHVDGFVLDPAIQPLLERWLLLSSRERWRRLQCEAYVLYISWLVSEPYSARRWIDETAYHGEQLQREGYQLDDCFPSCCYQPPPPPAERPGEDVELRPGPWNEGLSELRDRLAELYDTQALSRQIVAEAGLRPSRIAFSPAADTNWFNILSEAVWQNKVGDLVRVARKDFPEQAEALSLAERKFYAQIAALSRSRALAASMTAVPEDPAAVERIVSAIQPNVQAIRALLGDVFGRGELRRFCCSRPRWQPVCEKLKPKMNRDRQITALIRYCQKHQLLSQLLTELRQIAPHQYERHEPGLYGADELPEGSIKD